MKKYYFDSRGNCSNPDREIVFNDHKVLVIKILTANSFLPTAARGKWTWGYEIIYAAGTDFLIPNFQDDSFFKTKDLARTKALSYLYRQYAWSELQWPSRGKVFTPQYISNTIADRLRSLLNPGIVNSDYIVNSLGSDATQRQGIKRKIERLANKLIRLDPRERKAVMLRIHEHFSKK